MKSLLEVMDPKFQHGYAPALALQGPPLKICDSELTWNVSKWLRPCLGTPRTSFEDLRQWTHMKWSYVVSNKSYRHSFWITRWVDKNYLFFEFGSSKKRHKIKLMFVESIHPYKPGNIFQTKGGKINVRWIYPFLQKIFQSLIK